MLRRQWFVLICICIATVLIFLAASWIAAGTLVTPAQHSVGPPPADLPAESITLHADSGTSLSGWFMPAENATATVILLHPLRTDRRAMLGRARLLHEAGYVVLLIDMQAHGESDGEQITAGYRERHDVTAVVRYARERYPDHRIGVVGRSLGGAAALLASRSAIKPLEIDALVLESVYPTVTEAVHDRVAMRLGPLHHVLTPVLLAQLRLRLGISPSQLRPIDHIADAGCPVLVASGDLDRRTTLAETERLYETALEPKQLAIFTGAAHEDLLAFNPEKYQNEVISFLNKHLTPTLDKERTP